MIFTERIIGFGSPQSAATARPKTKRPFAGKRQSFARKVRRLFARKGGFGSPEKAANVCRKTAIVRPNERGGGQTQDRLRKFQEQRNEKRLRRP